MGGWSIPFIEDGDEIVGIDIQNVGYLGELILQDIRTLDGSLFRDFDLICGSPPCDEFTTFKMNYVWYPKGPDLKKGFDLVKHFHRIVNEAKPKFWFMENVANMNQYISEFYPGHLEPIWHFKVSRSGRRLLWGNFPIPLSNDYVFNRRLTYLSGRGKGKAERAKIPYPIARFVVDVVKKASQ